MAKTKSSATPMLERLIEGETVTYTVMITQRIRISKGVMFYI